MINAILIDTRQQARKHDLKTAYFQKNGIQMYRSKLFCGDYTLPTNQSICVDTKKDLQELIGDIQQKTSPKSELSENLSKLFGHFGISESLEAKYMDIIWKEDEGRNVEAEILAECQKDRISEDVSKFLNKLYVARRGSFHREIKRAENNGIKLVVLVENKDGIKTLRDVFSWTNPRLLMTIPTNKVIGRYKNGKPKYQRVRKYPRATTGAVLAKSLITMEKKYGVKFEFCSPEESGQRIVEILEGK